MADVLVRQCTIRVVRRGGWSWGREPRKLLERALHLIPQLIAAELARLFPEDVEREIAAPVRLTIPLRITMLRDAVLDRADSDQRSSGTEHELSARVAGALRAAFGQSTTESQPAPPRKAAHTEPPPLPLPRTSPLPPPGPLTILAGWARQGRLAEQIRDFSPPAVRAWHDWIASRPTLSAHASDAADAIVEATLQRLLQNRTSTQPDEVEQLRQRLIAFAVLEAAAQGSLLQRAVRDRIDAMLPPPAPPSPQVSPAGVTSASISATAVTRRQAEAGAAAPSLPPAAVRLASTVQTTLASDIRVESALPFLLLGVLSRVGYLDVVSAVLAAAQRADALPLFAAMLAYKVLAPPTRGWLRTSGARAVAAAFSLLPEAPEDSTLATFSRAIADQVSPLDAFVACALVEGHRPGTPLLLTAVGSEATSRLLVSDVDGAFPIALAAEAATLAPLMQRLLHEIVLVPAVAATPTTLSALADAQLRFITDAPPGRAENWRTVRGHPGECWWSNDELTPDARLASAARQMVAAADAAAACWQAIAIERPSVPRSTDACDETLSLAATLALGSIAWELWREREPTSPQLALSRFQDLDARVHVDQTSVRVLLPLGRRFFDLGEHRLLDDVSGVPWFGGRVLRFASG